MWIAFQGRKVNVKGRSRSSQSEANFEDVREEKREESQEVCRSRPIDERTPRPTHHTMCTLIHLQNQLVLDHQRNEFISWGDPPENITYFIRAEFLLGIKF
jgi:hypothetical protein